MAKAIHWPLQFREEVIQETTDAIRTAFRLGRIYYDNHYWVDGEEVDIRVNHRIIRKARIVGEMKCCLIQDLDTEDLMAQKSDLRTVEAVIRFLSETYQQPVTPETVVTVVYYKNLPLDETILDVADDPHMA